MNLDLHPKAVGSLTSPPPVNPMGDTQYPASLSSLLPAPLPASANAEGNNPTTPTVGGIFQAFLRRWFAATSLGMIGAVATLGAFYFLMPPMYTSEIRFNVAAYPSQSMMVPGATSQGEFMVYKKSLEQYFVTPVFLQSALQHKGKHGRTAADVPTIRNWGTDAASQLAGRLKTDFFIGPELLRVSLSGKNPEDLADILNAIGDAFVEQAQQDERLPHRERIEKYRETEARLMDEYASLQRRLQDALKNVQNPTLQREERNAATQALRFRIQNMENELYKVRRDLNERKDDLDSLAEKLTQLETKLPPRSALLAILRDDPEVKSLQKRIDAIDQQLGIYRETLTPQAYKQIAGPLEEQALSLERRILDKEREMRQYTVEEYRKPIREDLKEKIGLATRTITRLSKEKTDLENLVQSLTLEANRESILSQSDPPEINQLRGQLKDKEQAIEKFRMQATLLEGEKFLPRVSPNSPATVPSSLDYSRFTKLGGASSVAVFFLIVGTVSLLEFMSYKVSDTSQVSKSMGLPILGTVPAAPRRMRKNPAHAPTDQELVWQHQVNEAVDGIRTILMHANRKESMRVVMVTSANSGEGKTTLASQLAASLSRAWKKVLLVDGDLRNPGCHTLFDVSHEPGLSEVLRGEIPPGDAVRGTPISRLWVLPAGNWDNHAIQSLSQEDVRKIVDQLKESYDFIIFDSCPVLPVNDTLLMAQHMDGVIFSVLRNVSRMPEIQAAQGRMNPLNIRALGAVLIGVNAEANPAYNYVNSQSGTAAV